MVDLICISLMVNDVKHLSRDFPGGPAVKTLCSQCRGPRFDPWLGTKIPHTATKPACHNYWARAPQWRAYVPQWRPSIATIKKKKISMCLSAITTSFFWWNVTSCIFSVFSLDSFFLFPFSFPVFLSSFLLSVEFWEFFMHTSY